MIKNGFLALALLAGVSAQGHNSGSTSTQDLLIQKLTQVQVNLAPADPARAGVLMRLADLHAEKARQMSMNEINEGCTVCEAGKKDRDKALSYYTEALGKIPVHSAAKVHLQMGHLYEMQNQLAKAEKSYQVMLEVSASPTDKAEANLSLGEMAFRKSDFKTAQGHYRQVLAVVGASSQGLAAYRSAWCSFRQGDMTAAIDQLQVILKDPKLQSRMAVSRGSADMQFLEEVSRDLATIMAARGIQDSDASTLYSLTPENFRMQQVTILAREGLRLGQKEADLKVWDFVYQKQSDPKARLEAQTRMAQLSFDLKKMPEAQKSFETALQLWGATDCTPASCEDAAKGLRQLVIGWNRIEKTKPSAELLNAYAEFLKVFSQDLDMLVWAAQANTEAGQFAQAAVWTAQANSLMLAQYNSEAEIAAKKVTADKLEKNLLLGIENAEKAKNEKLLASAQDDYLAKSVLKLKAFDVQYQKVYAIYQKGEYAVAADQLRELAVQGSGPQQIRIQAAELSLDALAFLKDDTRMQQWSTEYAQKYADKKSDFQNVKQKSILTQSAQFAQNQQADKALAVLAGFVPSVASSADRTIYLKNKIILNEKLNHIIEARVAVEDLLREKDLSAEDREFALGRKMWFAELELDFPAALKAAEQMKFSSLSQEEKVLKLALYSELADKDPKAYYTQYLKESKDQIQKALIAAQLVRISKNPEKDFAAYKTYIASNQELYARTVMSVYAETQDTKFLEKESKGKSASKADGFVLAERILLLGDLQDLSPKVTSHTIDAKNQKSLATGLKTRVQLLSKVDGIANRAIASGDWTAQLLSLDLVAKENQRFYNEVLSLPMPAGFTAEQENEYLMLLSQQVAPNQSTAQMAESKVKEFWAQSSASENFRQTAKQNPEWVPFIGKEVDSLVAVAPEDKKASWMSLKQEVLALNPANQPKPSFAELEKARSTLKMHPFQPTAIQEVLALEKKAQRPSMVAYLESRLASAEKREIEAVKK